MQITSNQISSRKRVAGVSIGTLALLMLTGCRMRQVACEAPVPVSAPPNTVWEQQPAWYSYDQALADAICARWHQLMAERSVPEDNGIVILEFNLLPDGNIEGLTVLKNTEGIVLASLCEKAVVDPAPYKAWPPRMAAAFEGSRSFQVRFEFDALGMGYISYLETAAGLLAEHGGKETTLLVFVHRRLGHRRCST